MASNNNIYHVFFRYPNGDAHHLYISATAGDFTTLHAVLTSNGKNSDPSGAATILSAQNVMTGVYS